MILTFVRAAAATSLALASSVAIGACGEDEQGGGTGVTVVATTTQVADIATNVAGDRAEVVGLLAPNSDPHDYEPQPSDAAALTDASVVLKSGGDVDEWADDLVESSGTDAPVVDLLDEVEPGGSGDPHWWQDPRNAVFASEAISDAFAQADPDGAKEYKRNGAIFNGEIEALDRSIAACMDAIPAEQRKLVTNHDALGFFAERYDIEILGSTIPALTTQAQPSVGETADLVELIRSENVNTIFPEAGVSADLERTIADDAGATVGGELYADTLGEDGSPGGTYLGALRSNAAAMATGFTGDSTACEL